MQDVLLYLAAAMTALWGVAHLFATKGVVNGFGDITLDNRRVIQMEWIVEGVALISTAAFVLAATIIQPEAEVSLAVYGVAVATLLTSQSSPCLLAFVSRSCRTGCAPSSSVPQPCSLRGVD
jgi:hypothetical protein